MRYIPVNGDNLSQFQLGTVQLGMRYGLGKDAEKPTEEAAFSILDTAVKLGVNNIDTANNYGDSQAIIGRWLAKRKQEGKDLPFIVTKIGPLDHSSQEALRTDILRQTEGCLGELGISSVDCLMFHDFEDYDTDKEICFRVFNDLKRQKICRYTALSAYSRHNYKIIAESGFDAVQIPLNVFDWTRIDDGGIQSIADAGMKIFARSTFLQGLVFHTPEDIDPRMSFCIPTLKRWRELCQEFQMEPSVLAMSFILSIPYITCAVLGCDTAEQVKTNSSMIDRTVTLSEKQMNRLHEAFIETPADVLNPGVWFNHT